MLVGGYYVSDAEANPESCVGHLSGLVPSSPHRSFIQRLGVEVAGSGQQQCWKYTSITTEAGGRKTGNPLSNFLPCSRVMHKELAKIIFFLNKIKKK